MPRAPRAARRCAVRGCGTGAHTRRAPQALALAEGKLRGDVGGRWHVHHHPHATRGRDAAEERALALAEGEVHGDVGGRWHVHQHPHSIAGSDEHEKRALALAEGKVHPHPYGRAHAAARNGAAEERALRLAEGKEGASARKSIAAGHATAIAKHEEEPVTIQTKWGPLRCGCSLALAPCP